MSVGYAATWMDEAHSTEMDQAHRAALARREQADADHLAATLAALDAARSGDGHCPFLPAEFWSAGNDWLPCAPAALTRHDAVQAQLEWAFALRDAVALVADDEYLCQDIETLREQCPEKGHARRNWNDAHERVIAAADAVRETRAQARKAKQAAAAFRGADNRFAALAAMKGAA